MLIPVFLFNGCSTEVDINGDGDDMPVVYCILNPNDTVHYVKLNKTFIGETDAYQLAQESDSLFFEEAAVSIEKYKNGTITDIIQFEKTTDIQKDTGLFASDKNIIYKSTRRLTEGGESDIGDNIYKLKIDVPSKNISVTSETKIINNLIIINPKISQNYLIGLTPSSSLNVEWKSANNARLYELTVRFHYLEITDSGTTEKYVDWKQPSVVSSDLESGKDMETGISGEGFLRFLSSAISADDNVNKRLAHRNALDFIFTLAGDELNTYIQVNKPSNSIVQERPAYTNIENGIGIFSTRYQRTISGKKLTDLTIDAIATNDYTSHLNFADHTDSYYNY